MVDTNKSYDLEERTAKFGEDVIDLCKRMKLTIISSPIISQLIRSATSVGANYMEVNGASSKKDFRNKIYLCRKEIQETKHWLRMMKKVCVDLGELERLTNECQELILIFSKITSTLR